MKTSPRSIERILKRETKRFRQGRYGLKPNRQGDNCFVAEETAIRFSGLMPDINIVEAYETNLAQISDEYQWSNIRRAQIHPHSNRLAAWELYEAYKKAEADSKSNELREEIADYATHLISKRPFITIPR